MSTPLLATKLYRPLPRPNVVLRPRLSERLNAGLHRKLTLISAPAGFGKTTLLSAWVAACDRPTAWLSLDAGDTDPARFLTYLVTALQTIAATIGDGVLAVLQAPQPPPTETILTALLNDIATISDQFVLVLDDYHMVDAAPVDQALTFLLEHLPPQLHLVIATREDPQLPLATLRVRGQLTELRATDLRFTPAEAADFFKEVMGLNLSAADIAALERRTEGWIAGLQLAALSLQGQHDATRFIQSFTGTHQFVLDYLLEEVLQQQPANIQTFLLRTSILDRLCGPLCDAVVGDSAASGQATLEYLDHANLFLVPLDNERRWYRFHQLFADVLHARAMQHQPTHVAILHLRASEWYEQNGLRSDAIRHALAADDFERAAGLVELALPEMDGRLQSAMWLGWVQALPDELVRARPVLSVGYAWAFLDGGALESAEARLRDAERWLETTADVHGRLETSSAKMVVVDEAQFRSLPASIATARAYLAQARSDVPSTIAYARRVLDLVPEGDYLRRGQATTLLGLAYWASGDLEAAHRSFAEFMANMWITGNLPDAISATFVLADIRLTLGRFREAFKTYEQSLLRTPGQSELSPLGTEDLYRGRSELHREQGDLEAAARDLLISEKVGEHAALPDWHYRLCLAQARMKQSQGDLDGALDLLDAAERLHIRTPLPDVRPIGALKTRVRVEQGRLTEAREWVRERGLSVDDDLSYLREFEHITFARVLIAQRKGNVGDGPIHDALSLLERLLHAAEEGGRMGSVIEILVLRALAYQALDTVPAALASLERALTLAEPEGYVRIFVDEGPPMALLLSQAAVHGVMPDYVRRVLAGFVPEKPTPDDLSRLPLLPSDHSLIEPLSGRELEVLHLVAQGLSNREISERLFLAVSTVKGHNRTIFAKLQVHRRTQAIAHARALGLL